MDVRFNQWEKQIQLFKNTEVYRYYRLHASDEDRLDDGLPMTPRLTREGKWSHKNPIVNVETTSKRSFDGILRKWKTSIWTWVDANRIFIPQQYDFDDSKCNLCGQKAVWKCPCFRVGYCSEECQTKAWPTHKPNCTICLTE